MLCEKQGIPVTYLMTFTRFAQNSTIVNVLALYASGVDKGDGVLNYIQSRFGNLTSQVVSTKYKIAVVS